MEDPKRKRTTTTPDVDTMAAKAAKMLHKAAKSCQVEQRKAGKGGHLSCTVLGLAAVVADNYGALAELAGTKAEALRNAPLALVEAIATTKPVVVEAGQATRPAEVPIAPTSNAVQEK
ncbi:MAG: hypothetical protein HY928_04065 [Elusimicrobia bacterium]|nr:hypothetical protein [Elusimicrobiota bacterium]